jgi:hypothetical protein
VLRARAGSPGRTTGDCRSARKGKRLRPGRDGPDRVSIAVIDTAPRARRIAARFPEPFAIFFRASWIDNDRAFAVNRNWPRSHFVLFDEFLSQQ